MSDLVRRLQQTLELFYRVQGPASAEDFCLKPEHRALLIDGHSSNTLREVLYVAPSVDATDIGLYIDKNVVRRAEQFVITQEANALDDFCVALEGVSHFLYLTYCSASLDRPVSQIELELQAEVDKYLLLRILFGIKDLVGKLFRNIHWHERIEPESFERYRVANRQAQRYAQWVERCFRQGDIRKVLVDARALYRKPMALKLEHIACAP